MLVTSVVIRVTRLADENLSIFAKEKVWMLRNIAARRFFPKPMAAFAPYFAPRHPVKRPNSALHSRLLERSSRLSDELGGGSITALPIIETQAGDVSAYIPTNVISITDGQIFLESNLFNAGMRPAVNVGLSVSRVGGAAQTKAMKKASGSIRIDLAQYREMEVFTQFASDLDDATKAQLAHGKALMELLKQPLCHPLSLHEQVMTLIMANHGVFDTIETKDVKKYQGDILSYMDLSYPEIGQKIEENRAIDEELVNKIMDAVKEYKG